MTTTTDRLEQWSLPTEPLTSNQISLTTTLITWLDTTTPTVYSLLDNVAELLNNSTDNGTTIIEGIAGVGASGGCSLLSTDTLITCTTPISSGLSCHASVRCVVSFAAGDLLLNDSLINLNVTSAEDYVVVYTAAAVFLVLLLSGILLVNLFIAVLIKGRKTFTEVNKRPPLYMAYYRYSFVTRSKF